MRLVIASGGFAKRTCRSFADNVPQLSRRLAKLTFTTITLQCKANAIPGMNSRRIAAMMNKKRRAGRVLGIAGLALGLLVSGGIVSAETNGNGTASSDTVGTETVTTVEAGTSTSTDSGVDTESNQRARPHHSLLLDIKDYYTAPLRWDIKDWAYFSGALAAIAGAHHYDTQVRTHFIKDGARIGGSTDDLKDAVPTIAALGAT